MILRASTRIAAIFALCLCVACAVSEQAAAPSAVVAIPPEQAATPEFHGAELGADALRGHVPGE